MVNNLIDKRAAIDAICKHFNYDENDDFVYWNREHVLRVLRDLPSAQPERQKGKWIPCSERLPEEDHWAGGSGKQFSDNVLVSIYNSDDEDEWVDVSQTIDGEWRIELLRHHKIVAWMPLPEAYKEGDSDEQQ